MDLRGRVALVTGGAQRLGWAIVLALATRGVSVAVHYNTSQDAARETVEAARRLGVDAIALPADLNEEEAVRGLVPAVRERLRRLDVLVNSASIFERGGFAGTTAPSWDRHFRINLRAPFLLSQAFAAQVPDGQTAKIVNLTDWRGLRPGTDHFAYTITKAALIALTQSMAVALAPQIQVNCLALGAILLPAGADDRVAERLIASTPAKRLGEPDDVTGALLYLLGADYVTGETLLIDGGRHLV